MAYGMHLEDLIVGPELPEFFQPDASLDVQKQIAELTLFLTTPLKVENAKRFADYLADTEDVFPYLPQGFNILLQATYPDFSSMVAIAMHVFGITNKQKIKGYHNAVKRARQHEYKAFASDLVLLMVERSERTEKTLKRATKDADEPRTLGQMQQLLVADLIEKNKIHLAVVRNMSYATVSSKEFGLSTSDFFGQSGDKDSFAYARVHFGLAACHIGYFAKPQYGKWESMIAASLKTTPEIIMKEGIFCVERTPEEAMQDLNLQLKTEALLYKFAIHQYAQHAIHGRELGKKIDSLEKEAERRENYIGKLKDQKKKAEEDLHAERRKKPAIREVTTSPPKPIINVGKVECFSFPELDRQIKAYERDLERANKEISTLKQQVGDLEKKLETQRKNHTPQEPYTILINPFAYGFWSDPNRADVIKAVQQKIVQPTEKPEVIRKSSITGWSTLSRQFPGHACYFKLRHHDWRVAYVRKGNAVEILRIDDHDNYLRTWGN